MPLEIGKTNDKRSNKVNMMVVGEAKTGKTTFALTFPGPLVIDTDMGTSVARDKAIPRFTITPIETAKERETHLVIRDIFLSIKNKKGEIWESLGKYKLETIVLDSGSALSDLLEVDATIKPADGKERNGSLQIQDYNWIQRRLYQIIRDFASLPYNFVCTWGIDYRQDASGRAKEHPKASGEKLGPQLPHFFDEVLRFWYESGKFMGSPVPSRTFGHAGSRLHLDMKDYVNPSYQLFVKKWFPASK